MYISRIRPAGISINNNDSTSYHLTAMTSPTYVARHDPTIPLISSFRRILKCTLHQLRKLRPIDSSYLPPTNPPPASGAPFAPSPAPAVSRRRFGSNRRPILRILTVLSSPEVADVDSFADRVAGTGDVASRDERLLASSSFSSSSSGWEWDITAAFSDCAGTAAGGCGDPASFEFSSSATRCGVSAVFGIPSFAASPGRPAFPAFPAGINLASDYSVSTFAASPGRPSFPAFPAWIDLASDSSVSTFAASPRRPAFPAFPAGIDLASDYFVSTFAAVTVEL